MTEPLRYDGPAPLVGAVGPSSLPPAPFSPAGPSAVAAPGRAPARPGELSATAEAAVRGYLRHRPDATVVALGEGLGTGFGRLDNGRLTWLSVLPTADAAARRMVLPDGPRRRTVARTGPGADWPALVGPVERGVVVAVSGAPAGTLRELLGVCAAHFPGGALVVDALPWWAAALALPARLHPGVAAVRTRPLAAGGRSGPRPVVCAVRFAARGAR
ncbi:class I SAM-dependent methyltransferase [Streptomyces sp. NPDC056149]|uniref:class I SAM-dependent methyltransferase n=1 Tax=unclassified Streptomyces TaxID=2593676 RepID=UPI0023814F43|nr:class I SAM-dependent methyltransferase [Streptomyces sp. WZ-12]